MKELEPNSRRPQEDASNDVLSHPPQECLINRAQGSSLFVHATLISWFSKDMRSSKPLHMLFLRDMTAEKKKTDLLEIEKQRSEGLLKNILPASVAVRLNNGETSIADFCAQCTILFFDMAGFTAMSSKMTPQEVVSTLNTVYSGFDDIFVRHSVEKIKCIGDSVMVAAGVPEKRQDHAKVIIDVALDMVEHMHQINELYGSSINFRIGINSGPVVAGVLGKVKWAYDLFGDSVNLASRMESTSPLGRIQVSRSTYELTYTAFDFEERGPVDCKGKGAVAAYLVISPKQQLVDKK
jgi:class 3 adenylate cyclase